VHVHVHVQVLNELLASLPVLTRPQDGDKKKKKKKDKEADGEKVRHSAFPVDSAEPRLRRRKAVVHAPLLRSCCCCRCDLMGAPLCCHCRRILPHKHATNTTQKKKKKKTEA
jgi:hypothetical protein